MISQQLVSSAFDATWVMAARSLEGDVWCRPVVGLMVYGPEVIQMGTGQISTETANRKLFGLQGGISPGKSASGYQFLRLPLTRASGSRPMRSLTAS
jgi:hypothetical protein